MPRNVVSQEAWLQRTGTMAPANPVEGVKLHWLTPNLEPEGQEGLMDASQAYRIEIVDFRADAGTVVASGGYYFDSLGVLCRPNYSRVHGSPRRHQLEQLVEFNGPMTLVIRQEKAIPVVEGRQLPGAKAVYEAMVAAAKTLAAPGQMCSQALAAPTLGDGLFSKQEEPAASCPEETAARDVRRPKLGRPR